MLSKQDKDKSVQKFWFGFCHGRTILDAEIGCYLSHLKALQAVVDQQLEYAIICEDDIEFNNDFSSDTNEILRANPSIDVLKLLNHRCHGFKELTKTKTGKSVGYTYFGPLGSAAAYGVSLQGAQKILHSMEKIFLPYDNALERGWANKFEIQCVEENWLKHSALSKDTQICSDYKRSKIAFPFRFPTLIFRVKEIFARVFYVLNLGYKYR